MLPPHAADVRFGKHAPVAFLLHRQERHPQYSHHHPGPFHRTGSGNPNRPARERQPAPPDAGAWYYSASAPH